MFASFSYTEVLLEPEAEFVIEDVKEERLPESGNSYMRVILRAIKKEPVLAAAVKAFEKKCQERSKSAPPKKEAAFDRDSDKDDEATTESNKHKRAPEHIFVKD